MRFYNVGVLPAEIEADTPQEAARAFMRTLILDRLGHVYEVTEKDDPRLPSVIVDLDNEADHVTEDLK